MRLNEAIHDGVSVFDLEGEIDFHYAPILRSLLRSKIRQQCPALLLDLGDVYWIDSTGIATIIEYLRDSTKYGGVFCLTGLNDTLRSIFEVVRLDTLVSIFPSQKDALEAIRKGQVRSPKAGVFDLPERRAAVPNVKATAQAASGEAS